MSKFWRSSTGFSRSWCQQIRSVSKVPVIFLSSRTQNMDVIMAINMGADDCIEPIIQAGQLLQQLGSRS
ncbi:hypothetical protein [Paenibacillus camerounensis]|uniref:hypothetical protein n=1 Tax=Paenibacillus camerounensis TaxID=1243663 RepID=UPI000A79297A|nr:hypothetical protein [Paenibacillus camerounensis]